MTSKITINIETDDAGLAGRIAAAFGATPQPFVGEHSDAPGASSTACDDQHTTHPDDAPGGSHPQTAGHAGTAAEAANAQHAETTAGAAHTADTPAGAHGAADQGANSSNARRDQHGVAFNEHYCGEAQDPFYSSGKRSGQWKKKRGVSDKDYDDWYAEELAELREAGGESQGDGEHHPGPVNTAGAFGNGGQQQHQQQHTASGPKDTGEFMGWVSEKQAAGLLTQQDIQDAYNQTGLQVPDLFPPNDPQTVAGNVQRLYDLLAPKAGA